MKIVKTYSALVASVTLVFALGASTDSYGKKMSGSALGAALTACLLADDTKSAETSTRFACCSRDAGICVVCPNPPSAGGACDVTNYRMEPIPGALPMSASSIDNVRQKMQLPPRGTKAPSAAKSAAPLPGVLPNSK